MNKTNTTPTHWLSSICEPNHRKEIIQRPHVIVWRGKPWAVATDGKILIALCDALPGIESPTPAIAEKMLSVLDTPTTTTPLDWPKFRAWIGPQPEGATCRKLWRRWQVQWLPLRCRPRLRFLRGQRQGAT